MVVCHGTQMRHNSSFSDNEIMRDKSFPFNNQPGSAPGVDSSISIYQTREAGKQRESPCISILLHPMCQ